MLLYNVVPITSSFASLCPRNCCRPVCKLFRNDLFGCRVAKITPCWQPNLKKMIEIPSSPEIYFAQSLQVFFLGKRQSQREDGKLYHAIKTVAADAYILSDYEKMMLIGQPPNPSISCRLLSHSRGYQDYLQGWALGASSYIYLILWVVTACCSQIVQSEILQIGC